MMLCQPRREAKTASASSSSCGPVAAFRQTMAANHLRLRFATIAYALVNTMRRQSAPHHAACCAWAPTFHQKTPSLPRSVLPIATRFVASLAASISMFSENALVLLPSSTQPVHQPRFGVREKHHPVLP
jgi:hypothetical protein